MLRECAHLELHFVSWVLVSRIFVINFYFYNSCKQQNDQSEMILKQMSFTNLYLQFDEREYIFQIPRFDNLCCDEVFEVLSSFIPTQLCSSGVCSHF